MSWTIFDPWDRIDAPNPVRIAMPCFCHAAFWRTAAGTWEWIGKLCIHCSLKGPCWEIVLC